MQMNLWSKKFLGSVVVIYFSLYYIESPVQMSGERDNVWLTYTLFCNCSSYTLGDISYSASFIHLI